MDERKKVWLQRRKRVSEIIEAGNSSDWVSRGYDIFGALCLLVNLVVAILDTFHQMMAYNHVFILLETITVVFFTVDYVLRLWTAPASRPGMKPTKAVCRYVFSFFGIVDLLSFLPFFLPIFFPAGAATFRIFRMIRIFRLFQINAYYDSLSVITGVLKNKRQQLISSVFIILVLMLASSLCMYSLEHEAQPEVFSNAFSGIWWSVSTLLTIGYGDIYPITTLGKVFSIIITFLGVGMVAIPTGIISAGFVEQYSRIKRLSEYAAEEDVHFIKVKLQKKDGWTGKAIKELELPHGVIIAMIRRDQKAVIPRGDVVLEDDDTIILGAEALKDDKHIELKEVVLLAQNPWNGQYIRDLDISRQSIIVMVKRKGTMLVPKGSLMLQEGDHVILYTQERMLDARRIEF